MTAAATRALPLCRCRNIAALTILCFTVGCAPRASVQDRPPSAHLNEGIELDQVRSVWRNPGERREEVEALLAEPLGMDQALQVALLNNPGLQADLAEVDLREGSLRQEAAIANPELHSEFFIYGPDTWALHRVEASVEFNITDLLARAARLRAARSGVEAGRAQAAERILAITAEVRRAWIQYAAAQQLLERRQQVNLAAEAAAETAGIYHDAGNLADDELYQILAFAAEARQTVFRAEDALGDWREELALLLGLPADGDWSVPSELAMPPEEPSRGDQLHEQALQHSPLLQRLEREKERHQALLRASRRQGWLPALRLGVVADWREGELEMGPTLGVAIPIFDRRRFERDALEARRNQLDFQQDQQINRIQVLSVRVARRLSQNHRLALHYSEEILPLRERLVEESLRQYNAMTIGVFELLDARRAHLQAEANYVEVLRDFWLARVDYEHLLAGGVPGDEPSGATGRH